MDTRVEMYWISQLSAHNCNEKPVVTLTTDEFVLNALKFLTLVNDILDTSVTKPYANTVDFIPFSNMTCGFYSFFNKIVIVLWTARVV